MPLQSIYFDGGNKWEGCKQSIGVIVYRVMERARPESVLRQRYTLAYFGECRSLEAYSFEDVPKEDLLELESLTEGLLAELKSGEIERTGNGWRPGSAAAKVPWVESFLQYLRSEVLVSE
jgi:hypothetical protein